MYDTNTILVFGIIFGILLMTIVYTLIRYIYSKELMYIAYCFLQLFSLFYIIIYSKLFSYSYFFQELSLVFASLCAIVFAVSFYEGKFIPKLNNFKELIVNTILLNIVILTSFYHYMLFEYLPYTIIYAILFLSVVFNLKDDFSARLLYVLGWSVLCILLFIFDFKSYYETKAYFDIVLIAFAIEAVLFTLSLSYKYNFMKKETKRIEKMLLQQSRLAKSGEMIGNITHQFRQPLNSLSYILINLKTRYENNKLKEEYFFKKVEQANKQIEFLSKTIEDFKSFYSPSKKKESFLVKEAIDNSLGVLSAELKKGNIETSVEFKTHEHIKVYGIKSELSQVLMALVSNAAEALINTYEPKVKIEISSNEAEVLIKIWDNAGGIKEKNINKIFESYYSTKEKGSGIGLYLVKLIIEESFLGKIEVENKNNGACFTISMEK